MATQVNILQLNGGVPASDPTNGFLYIVISGIDGFISIDNLLKYMLSKSKVRAAGSVAVTTGENVIAFEVDSIATPMDSTDYSIIPFSEGGVGGEITAKTVDNFTFEALDNGTLNYIVILNT